MDILVRNVKTGEERHLPIEVYNATKKSWTPIEKPVEIEKPVVTDPGELKNLEILEKVTNEPLTKDIVTEEPESEASEKSKEELQAEYETLSGKKPDGRWSDKKLSEQIKELKETNK